MYEPKRKRTPGFAMGRSIVETELRGMEGRAVKSVRVDEQETHTSCHQSEFITLEFADGATLQIGIGTNIQNVVSELEHSHRKGALKHQDLHASFTANWLKK